MAPSGIRFADKQVPKIISGEKSCTRINIPCPWTVGQVITAFQAVEDSDRPFALLKVTSVSEQKIGDMTEEDANKEGYESLLKFKEAWTDLHGQVNDADVVWAVGFELVKTIDEEELNTIM